MRQELDESAVKISVVVPVFNGGRHLATSAASLLGQTMAPEAYEVIYVDDGSTDDSPAQLAALAEAHPQVVVLTEPPSGWPGRPRNVGLDHARGVYVQFVDQDDRLGRRALERLWRFAEEHRPDVVLGKMGGGMASPNLVFKRNVALGDLATVPAIQTLTGHKMFRLDFLREHGIRFPEGYWRGEDLLFVARAYARSPSLAVLADYVCYYWDQHEGGHHSLAPYELAGHYDRLRQIIAALREGTEPGELQDTLLRRLYRVELMARLRKLEPATLDDELLVDAFGLSGEVARTSFPPGVREGLPGVPKLQAALLEAGDLVGTSRLNERVAAVRPLIDRTLVLAPDGSLTAHLEVALAEPDGRLLGVAARGDRWLLDPELTAAAGSGAEVELADPHAYAHAELQLFDPDAEVWWYPEGELEPRLRPTAPDRSAAVAVGDVVLDPRTAAAGRPLDPGTYWVWVVVELLGVGRRRRLVVPAEVTGDGTRWTVASPRRLVRYDWSVDGRRVQLQVQDRRRWLAREVRAADRSLPAPGPGRDVPVRLRAAHAEGSSPVQVELRAGDVRAGGRAVLVVDGSGRRGRLRLRTGYDLPDGDYAVSLGGRGPVLARLRLRKGRLVHLRAASAPAPSAVSELLRRVGDRRSWRRRLRGLRPRRGGG